ncbi:MAG: zinc-dependent peptidase, partial [Candidatus Kapaibacterium sp.]
MFGFFRRRHRPELREQPFPAEWLEIVKRNFPLYQRLPADDQKELLGDAQVFLAEKKFEGCDGLEITDEIRVT